MKHSFGIGIEVDKMTGETLAVYFKLRAGKSAETKEFAEGAVFVDYNSQGELLGVEMLAPCSIKVLDRITSNEPESRDFVRNKIPREMIAV